MLWLLVHLSGVLVDEHTIQSPAHLMMCSMSLIIIIIIIVLALLLPEEHELAAGAETDPVDYASPAHVQVVTVELADHRKALLTQGPGGWEQYEAMGGEAVVAEQVVGDLNALSLRLINRAQYYLHRGEAREGRPDLHSGDDEGSLIDITLITVVVHLVSNEPISRVRR